MPLWQCYYLSSERFYPKKSDVYNINPNLQRIYQFGYISVSKDILNGDVYQTL
jgi:hypothetical protein